MKQALTFTLPWPPSINNYYGRRPRGGVYLKPDAKTFRLLVLAALRDEVYEKITGPVEIDIYASPPDKRIRDLDNIEKPLLDALQHAGVFENDFQITRKQITRMHVEAGGVIRIRVAG
jgi:crossover junction endodeoxyribonuclease RusA